MEAPAPLPGPQNTPRGGRETLENQHPQPMVVDVDLGALRRPHPVHKGAPEGSPETLKKQHGIICGRFRACLWPVLVLILGRFCGLPGNIEVSRKGQGRRKTTGKGNIGRG